MQRNNGQNFQTKSVERNKEVDDTSKAVVGSFWYTIDLDSPLKLVNHVDGDEHTAHQKDPCQLMH